MVQNRNTVKTKKAFKVWMLIWAFAIFNCNTSGAQNQSTFKIGDYRTTSSGTLSQAGGSSTLEQLSTDGKWIPAAYPLPTSATLFVEYPAQIEANLQLATLFLGAQKKLFISPSAKLTTTTQLTVSTAAELVQEGTLENQGLLQLQANSLLVIKSSAYDASSTIWAGREEIDATSEVRVEAATPNSLLFNSSALTPQSHGYWFGKLTVALSQPGNAWKLVDASAPLAAQTFTTSLATSSSLTFLSTPNTNLTFGQNVNLTGGTYFLQNQSTSTSTLAVNGHLALQNAPFTLNQTSSGTAISTIDLKGSLTSDANSSITNSSTVNTSTSGIRFVGNTWQVLQVAGPVNHVSLTARFGAMVRLAHNVRLNPSNSVYAGTFTVENGAILDFGADNAGIGYQVQGAGYFRLNQGGTLYITSAQGINASGATGNVVVTDSRRTFTQLATFVYNSRLAQVTGNAFTTTANGKILIIDNPTSVTLTSNTGISSNTTLSPQGGRLEIRRGTFITTPTADITSSGRLLMTGGTYQIGTLNTIVPLLTGAYDLLGGAIELAGNGDQVLRGRTYLSLIISGNNTANNTAKSISTTTSITQNLTIFPNAVFDVNNKTLQGDGGLTMTGGLLRISKVGGPLPELTGKNNSYALTGGTIEFYGTINGQNQSIRSNHPDGQKITYHHLLLSSTEANTTTDLGNILPSANLDLSGTITVKSPTVLQIASNRAIAGNGNFVLEAGATLLYGSPQGIKLAGTGTADGNIRVSGTRTFSPQANYGFIGVSDMVSGDGLPGTVANLLAAKTGGGVTLSKGVNVSGTFTLRSGYFKTDAYEVSLLNADLGALQVADTSLYIQGTLRRAIGSSSTYSFPIGIANGKRPFEFTSLSLAGNGFQNVAVSFKPLTNHNNADLLLLEGGNIYNNIAPAGVWVVEPNAVPSTGYYTAQASLQGFSNLSDNKFSLLVRPANSTSGKDWTTGGGSLDAPNKDGRTVASGYAKRNFIKSFGQLGIGTVEGTLPVSWLYVTAEQKNNQVHLQWATTNEINNEWFNVEYSTDAKNFTSVGRVNGAGNSNTVQHYTFQHSKSASGTGYYRIKQTDYDGKFEYSKVVAVKTTSSALAQVILYPNPSQEYVHLANLTLEASTQIDVIDAKGKQVGKLRPVSAAGSVVVPVQHLATGNYILRIKQDDALVQLRFVKL